MVFLDLFSGIGGFSLGFKEAGFNITTHYFSEIDKHAIAIYKYHFKNAINVGNVTTLSGRSIARPNIVTFGSPCQDFSLAGQRAGLGGERSSLIWEAIRFVAECRPDVFIWENVKGVFFSNAGADFWAVIKAFADIGSYRLEWQLLNTAWFLPQNRERVYLVGYTPTCRGDWRGIFPIGENDRIPGKGDEEKRGKNSETCTAITSNYRRGVHAKGETLVISHHGHKNKAPRKSKIVPTLCSESHGHVSMIADDVHDTITTALGRNGSSKEYLKSCARVYSLTSNLRRLTEIECERLQGFPDDWTRYGDYDGKVKEISKTQRYKTLGDAVSIPVVKAVALKIKELYS